MPFIPRETIQRFSIINYKREMVMLAMESDAREEKIVGIGQYIISQERHEADVSVVVSDDMQNKGIGSLLLQYLANIAMREGILAFTASILSDNRAMLHVIDKLGYEVERSMTGSECAVRVFLGKM
jgi:GNAT superfamily N-acetyltransferase